MSLASRRRMMLKGGAKAEEPVIDWSLSVLPHNEKIPFPYTEYKYALKLQETIISSDNPIYIYKSTWRDYYIVIKQPYNAQGKGMMELTVDTSDLGDGTYLIAKYRNDIYQFTGCNYPVLEVRYNEDRTKLFVVRE
jgi:hypothetical protein